MPIPPTARYRNGQDGVPGTAPATEWLQATSPDPTHMCFPMRDLTRITLDPQVMGGKPCIRGMRVTVGTLVGLIAAGHTIEEVLDAYPYLEEADIREALAYAAWRAEEIELPLRQVS